MSTATLAYWLREPGVGEIRSATVPEPGPDEVLVRTLRTGVSRGTETLVFRGGVPPSQYDVMRAPFQEGDFPGPVKYGYLNVGVVEAGPAALVGRIVFCLYPHQTRYVVPAAAVTVVPDGVPPARAVLAGAVETAVNAMWDAGPLIGDRIAVVGGGMIGCCVTRLLARMPGVRVTLVDVDRSRADLAAALGAEFAVPDEVSGERDLVVHASATSAGLQTALDLLAIEGTVLDLSWYGDALGRHLAGWCLSFPPADHPGQPGRHGVAVPTRQQVDRRPTRTGDGAVARQRFRCATHRRIEFPGAARRDAPAGRRNSAGVVPHHHLWRGVTTCSRSPSGIT